MRRNLSLRCPYRRSWEFRTRLQFLNRSPDQQLGTVNAQFNYNVNLPAVQLPSWDEFSKYPPEVRDFWMRMGEKEQDARHNWINKEQDHRHSYDHTRLSGTFERQKTGQILGACLSCFCISAGAAIVIAGGSPWGYAAILAGITPLVGMAIYAKNVAPPKMGENETNGHHEAAQPVHPEEKPQA
jgi:uncharacterized membrane protein